MTPKEFAEKLNDWPRGTMIGATARASCRVIVPSRRTTIVVDAQVPDDQHRLVATLMGRA